MQNESKRLNQFISLMLPAELEQYFVVKDKLSFPVKAILSLSLKTGVQRDNCWQEASICYSNQLINGRNHKSIEQRFSLSNSPISRKHTP